MDKGLEAFIAYRRAEGYSHVVISHDGGAIGWGRTPNEAWHMAIYFTYNRHDPEYLPDAELFDTAPDGVKVEDWHRYNARRTEEVWDEFRATRDQVRAVTATNAEKDSVE